MRVLVVEDEKKLASFLRKGLVEESFVVDLVYDGSEAIDHILSGAYDAIVLDIMLPQRDGLSILREMRQRHINTPVLLLSARGNVNERVEGLNLGADDYLPKPFTRNELMEAVNSRLKKFENLTQALAARLVPKRDRLTQKFREKISGGDGTAALEETDPGTPTGKIAEASVLFSDIRNFTTYSERLTSDEIAELLNAYLQTACAPIIRCRGVVMKFIGDGVMALFESSHGEGGESHAQRAVRAGLAMQLAALEFREWVKRHHPSQSLPEFSIGVGIHSGEVLLCHVGTPGRRR